MFNYLPDSIVGCNTIHGLLRSLAVNRCVTVYAPSIVRGQRRRRGLTDDPTNASATLMETPRAGLIAAPVTALASVACWWIKFAP